MRTGRNPLASLIGIAALVDGLNALGINGRPAPAVSSRMQLTGIKNGHASWGNPQDAKVKRSRAKERRAKLARKLNWN